MITEVLITVLLIMVVLIMVWAEPRPVSAAPNPYGRSESEFLVVIEADGSYAVTLTERQALVQPFGVTFGGAVHDGFRLPGEARSLLPPYLRVRDEAVKATLDGSPTSDVPRPAIYRG